MRRVLLTILAAALTLGALPGLAAEPPRSQAFDPDRWGKEIVFKPVDRYAIHWTINFDDFLAEQTEQLRIEIEKFKPVRFRREPPISTFARGPIQVEPIHYPSVQFSAARW